jgi:hypothetical protein
MQEWKAVNGADQGGSCLSHRPLLAVEPWHTLRQPKPSGLVTALASIGIWLAAAGCHLPSSLLTNVWQEAPGRRKSPPLRYASMTEYPACFAGNDMIGSPMTRAIALTLQDMRPVENEGRRRTALSASYRVRIVKGCEKIKSQRHSPTTRVNNHS